MTLFFMVAIGEIMMSPTMVALASPLLWNASRAAGKSLRWLFSKETVLSTSSKNNSWVFEF